MNITVYIGDPDRPTEHRVHAHHVHGQWAVHIAVSGEGFTVTHIPSGMRTPTRALTENQANRLAAQLKAFVPEFAIPPGKYRMPEAASDAVFAVLQDLGMQREEQARR